MPRTPIQWPGFQELDRQDRRGGRCPSHRDGDDGEQEDEVVGDAQNCFANGADFSVDGAGGKSGEDEADGRQFKQRHQQNAVAGEAEAGGKDGQQSKGAQQRKH
jgi:hypothetical protein